MSLWWLVLSSYQGSRLRVVDTNRLNELLASDVVGMECASLMVVSERKMLTKPRTILDSVSRPLHDVQCKRRAKFSLSSSTYVCPPLNFCHCHLNLCFGRQVHVKVGLLLAGLSLVEDRVAVSHQSELKMLDSRKKFCQCLVTQQTNTNLISLQ